METTEKLFSRGELSRVLKRRPTEKHQCWLRGRGVGNVGKSLCYGFCMNRAGLTGLGLTSLYNFSWL
jgi:hypothetical protein